MANDTSFVRIVALLMHQGMSLVGEIRDLEQTKLMTFGLDDLCAVSQV